MNTPDVIFVIVNITPSRARKVCNSHLTLTAAHQTGQSYQNAQFLRDDRHIHKEPIIRDSLRMLPFCGRNYAFL
jgi:hypothetical protein